MLLEGFITLELGCGSGLPSMAAIITLGASHAIATDCEILPLQMLQRAVGKEYKSKLTTETFDLRQIQIVSSSSPSPSYLSTQPSPLSNIPDVEVDCCIASDLLYREDIAEKVALLLSEKYIHSKGKCRLVVTSPMEGRRGREPFVEKFLSNVISSDPESYANFDAYFEECIVPEWMNDGCVDGFDGCKIESVGVLRYGFHLRSIGGHSFS